MDLKMLWLQLRNSAPRTAIRGPSRRFVLEPLEDRTLLSVSILNHSGQGYPGLSFNQSGGYVPPDTNGAAGPSVYVESVNQSLAIYNPKATGASAVTDSLSHLLFTTGRLTRADSGSGLSDPVVTYDEQIGRFIVGDQDVDFNTHVSAFDLAVSRSNNPTTLSTSDWVFYKITTTESGFDADYPGNFGYNHDALVFTLNMFGVGGGGHVQVVAVNGSDLTNAATSPQVARNDLSDFSVRPTTMHDSVAGGPMWLVTEHGDNRSIDVIKMTGVLTTSAVFTYTNLPVTAVFRSGAAEKPQRHRHHQQHRFADHEGRGGQQHDRRDPRRFDFLDTGRRPVVCRQCQQRYADPGQQGRSCSANTYIVYPGIDINASGQIGMSYMKSGTDTSTD